MTQDDQRANFLLALDRSDEVDLDGFEAEFVESNLDRFNFSDKQRRVIDRLIAKYEVKIGWNPNNTRLAERQIHEQKKWSASSRVVARPTIREAQRLGFKEFSEQMSRFAARAQKPRKVERVKERIQRVNGTLRLSHAPVKPCTVIRNGSRLEDHWIDYSTGEFRNCPFLAAGDEVEYDFYPNPHG